MEGNDRPAILSGTSPFSLSVATATAPNMNSSPRPVDRIKLHAAIARDLSAAGVEEKSAPPG